MTFLPFLRQRDRTTAQPSADDERFAMAQLEAAQRRDLLVAGTGDGAARRRRRARR